MRQYIFSNFRRKNILNLFALNIFPFRIRKLQLRVVKIPQYKPFSGGYIHNKDTLCNIREDLLILFFIFSDSFLVRYINEKSSKITLLIRPDLNLKPFI